MVPRPRIVLALAALVFAPALAGAQGVGTRAAPARLVVHEGMTEAEVVATLGPAALTRRINEWSYLFYANGCPILCGNDDVVVLRGCRVVAGLLERPDRFFAGPAPVAALSWTIPSDCSEGAPPAVRPGPPNDVRPWIPLAPDSLRPRTDTIARLPARPDDARPSIPLAPDTLPIGRPTRESLLLPREIFAQRPVSGPAASLTSPTGFGTEFGEFFAGVGFQARTRYTEEADAAVVVGTGIGDRGVLALEVALTSYSTIRGGGPGEAGGLSFKLHRAFSENFGVAAGIENGIGWGDSDAGRSRYLSATHLFRRGPDPDAWLSAFALTVGAGDGRFRSEDDIVDDRDAVGVFGALGVRLRERVSAVADWSGQDLALGVSVAPFRGVPLSVTPGVADVTGSAGDGTRFILTVGFGTAFRPDGLW